MVVNALIIFQEELKQRNFFDWIISHFSGALPPHRYAGEIDIANNLIKFCGTDTWSNTESEFIIEKYRIEEIYYGYDRVYNVFQGRGLGLVWAPVRVKFTGAGGEERYAYFITSSDAWSSTNKDFYNYLVEWLS